MGNISQCVRMVLAKADISQKELAEEWNVSHNAIRSKFYRDAWSSRDLVDIARITGSRLSFVFPDGQEVVLTTDVPSKHAPRKEE